MAHSAETRSAMGRLLWVGVIAFVAAVLIRLWTESLLAAVLLGLLAAVVSMAVVWFVGWRSRSR